MSSPGRVAAEYVHRRPSSVLSDGHGGAHAPCVYCVCRTRWRRPQHARRTWRESEKETSLKPSADTALNTVHTLNEPVRARLCTVYR